ATIGFPLLKVASPGSIPQSSPCARRTAAQRLAFLPRPASSGYGTTRLPPWAHHASVEDRRLPGPRGPALLYGAGAVARAPGRARGGSTGRRGRGRGGGGHRETLRALAPR